MKTSNQLWALLGIIAGVAYAVWALMRDDGEGATVVDKLSDGFRDIVSGITQGKRVTNAPYSKSTGLVPGTPDYLAGIAGVDVEVYSLARNIASEEGNSNNETQAAVGWATLNYANSVGKSVTSLLTHAKYAPHSGSYGTQRNIEVGTTGYNGSDRYASTALDPYQGHIAIAQGVIDGTIPDITNGATQYDRAAGERDPDAVAAQRIAAGSTEVDLSDQGVDPGLRFWTKL